MALCERDIAIYASIFLFGILYAVTGRRLKPLHWVAWILIGMVPRRLGWVLATLQPDGMVLA